MVCRVESIGGACGGFCLVGERDAGHISAAVTFLALHCPLPYWFSICVRLTMD